MKKRKIPLEERRMNSVDYFLELCNIEFISRLSISSVMRISISVDGSHCSWIAKFVGVDKHPDFLLKER